MAAICHAPWMLVEADDIPAFNAKMIEEIAEGRHAEQREKTRAAR